MDGLIQDIRYAFRSIRRSPSFAVVATVTLAIAIGANAAIFAIVSAILFADLPYGDPDTLAIVRMASPAQGVARDGLSYPDYADLAEWNKSFEALAAQTLEEWVLVDGQEPVRVNGSRASTNLLRTWRRPVVFGRGFGEGSEGVADAHEALISHALWVQRYAGDPQVLGTTIHLDGTAYEIVGVMDPRTDFPVLSDAQVWVPLHMERTGPREDHRLRITGRLRQGVGPEQAQEELDRLMERLSEAYGGLHRGWRFTVALAEEDLVDDESDMFLFLLELTVVFVLVIACANVGNMLLARGEARTRELAVRAALGAGRIRIIRQLVTENLVVALAASALGLVLAEGMLAGLVRVTLAQNEALAAATIDGRVLTFTLGVAFFAPLLFGLLPALRGTTEAKGEALRGRGPTGGRGDGAARSVLAGGQMALALMLMVMTGMFVRTVADILQEDPGIDIEGLLSLPVDLPEARYADATHVMAFHDELDRRLRAIPTVRDVALFSGTPAVSRGLLRSLEVEGAAPTEQEVAPQVRVFRASRNFQQVLGLGTVRGRSFSDADGASTPPVVVISRETERRFFPDGDALGQRVRFTTQDDVPWMEVVGVVEDVANNPGEPGQAAQLYLLFDQSPSHDITVVARIQANADLVIPPVRSAVWEVDSEIPADDIRPVAVARYVELSDGYAILLLFGTFAVLAMIMSAVGLYGVMSYSVARRRGEFGVRLAMGADSGEVLRMILHQGVRTVAVGVGVGLAGAALLARVIQSSIYGTTAADPVVFLGVPALLTGVGLLAMYVPARRAMSLDPASIMRTE